MSENRDMGIEFGDLKDDLANEEYPLTKEEVVDRYGDRELEHASGSSSVREVLGPEGPDEFESQDELHQTILNMVGTEAVGRARYSDRGGSTPNERKEGEGVDEGTDEEDEQDSI